MAEFEMVFWYWWVLAVFLLGIEILAPGFFFLWLSIASVAVGAILFLAPSTSLEIQLLLFSILSILSIFLWRRYGIQQQTETDHPLLNKRGAQYVGRTFSLIEAIENGRGKVKADDSIWRVTGEDCPIGTQVEVTAVNGTLFEVKATGKKSEEEDTS